MSERPGFGMRAGSLPPIGDSVAGFLSSMVVDDFDTIPATPGEWPVDWQQAPWAPVKCGQRPPEHYVQAQMVCGGCEARMGLIMTAQNSPDALIVTCRCGFINTWRPR